MWRATQVCHEHAAPGRASWLHEFEMHRILAALVVATPARAVRLEGGDHDVAQRGFLHVEPVGARRQIDRGRPRMVRPLIGALNRADVETAADAPVASA